MLNKNEAPYPNALTNMVYALSHTSRPTWSFDILNTDRGQGSSGLTFCVYITEPDAYHPDQMRSVVHYFPVPPANYDVRSWRRWLFDRIRDVSTHEDMEGFTIESAKPYAPSHGPGNDPYMIREVGSELDVKTAFTGEVNG